MPQKDVYHIQSDEAFDILTQNAGNALVVLDFTASWCGPCKRIAPIVVELAKKYPDVVIAKIDVDQVPNVAQSLHVSSMPTFVFLRRGRELTRFSGANAKQLEESILNFSS